MSDKPHDLNRYGVALSTGEWEYRNAGDDRWVQHWVAPDQPRETPVGRPDCRTPADYRACAEVVERWEADHAPKMRRRVAAVSNRKWIVQGACLFCFPRDASDDDIRSGIGYTLVVGFRELPVLADLAARPDEEVPRGE